MCYEQQHFHAGLQFYSQESNSCLKVIDQRADGVASFWQGNGVACKKLNILQYLCLDVYWVSTVRRYTVDGFEILGTKKKENLGLVREELSQQDTGAAKYAQTYKLLTECLHHLIQSHHVYSVIYYYDLTCKLMALKCLLTLNIQQPRTQVYEQRGPLVAAPSSPALLSLHAASTSISPPFFFLSLASYSQFWCSQWVSCRAGWGRALMRRW